MKRYPIPPILHRQSLRKPLLSREESCLYLGLSPQELAQLEQNDPTFPKRANPSDHVKKLLDEWRRVNYPAGYNNKKLAQLSDSSFYPKISPHQLD